MTPADPVAFAKWRSDERTRIAQAVILDGRDDARERGQYTVDRGDRRLRLLLDDLDEVYRLAHLREWPPLTAESAPRPLTRKEFREITLAMLGGRLHSRPHVGWVLDLAPAEA